jgi:hypothetical protein
MDLVRQAQSWRQASAIHTVVSRTFGPSTNFVCPSVARFEDDTCRVYAAIESSSGVPLEEKGRWLWSWGNDLGSGVADELVQKLLVSVSCTLFQQVLTFRRGFPSHCTPLRTLRTTQSCSPHLPDRRCQSRRKKSKSGRDLESSLVFNTDPASR